MTIMGNATDPYYQADLDIFLTNVEVDKLSVYLNTASLANPTISIGFNLNTPDLGDVTIREMRRLSRFIAVGKIGLFLLVASLLALPLSSFADDAIIMRKVETDPKKIPLCLEFKQILDLPQNKSLIIGSNELYALEKRLGNEAFGNIDIYRVTPIYIPNSFPNFSFPTWSPVPNDEAKAKLGDFISSIYRDQKQRFGIDYNFVKTSIDLTNNGKLDTIYQQNGGSHSLVVEKNDSFLSKSFYQLGMSVTLSHAYIIFYGGNPYIFSNNLVDFTITKMVTATGGQVYPKELCDYDKIHQEGVK